MIEQKAANEELIWMVKSPEPSRMARALHTLRLKKMMITEPTRMSIAAGDLDLIDNSKLREELEQQALSGRKKAILPYMNADGSYSHSVSVPRGSIFEHSEK